MTSVSVDITDLLARQVPIARFRVLLVLLARQDRQELQGQQVPLGRQAPLGRVFRRVAVQGRY